jgi:cytochrome P450
MTCGVHLDLHDTKFVFHDELELDKRVERSSWSELETDVRSSFGNINIFQADGKGLQRFRKFMSHALEAIVKSRKRKKFNKCCLASYTLSVASPTLKYNS